MIISGTCGRQEVNTEDELLHLLRSSRNGDFAEFWLGEKGSPVLAIQVNRSSAYLWYSAREGHPGFNSVGDMGASGQLEFLNDICMPRMFVVSADQAYQVAVDFFESRNLPGCINWSEL